VSVRLRKIVEWILLVILPIGMAITLLLMSRSG
jgi:hypothetical protein